MKPYIIEVRDRADDIMYTVITSKKEVRLDLAKVERTLNKDFKAFALYWNNELKKQERIV